MLGRIYRVPISGTIAQSSGDYDLLNVSPADDKPCMLFGWSLGQITEAGDAAAEMLDLSIRKVTGSITDSSGGDSITVLTPPGYASVGFTARSRDSAITTQTGGADDLIERRGWNLQAAPYDMYLPEELIPATLVRQGERLIVRLETAVADDLTIKGVFYVIEI
jgi:hypothetical protein